jgi:lysophospholipase L1-like esterase
VESSQLGDFAERNHLTAPGISRVLGPGGQDMKTNIHTPYRAWRIMLVAAALPLGACDAVNELANRTNDSDTHYYLSLGTSLSVGIQPDGSGVLRPTNDGYADQLYDLIRPGFESSIADAALELDLNKLGCPGETLDDMINGGNCVYIAGSQLDAAVDFLNDNSGKVHLVTIDMGANDFIDAGCITTTVDLDCVNAVTNDIADDLATVLTALRNAAGPNTTIVGMNYYNPYLASWLVDPAGPALAIQSAQAAIIFNDALFMTYDTAGMSMADVYMAFDSDDFVDMVDTPNGQLPESVANLCAWTYNCDPPPVGPDIHANFTGYSVIADELAAELP